MSTNYIEENFFGGIMRIIIILGFILILNFNAIYSAKWQQIKSIEGKTITQILTMAVDFSNSLIFSTQIPPYTYLVIWDGNNFHKVNLSDFLVVLHL